MFNCFPVPFQSTPFCGSNEFAIARTLNVLRRRIGCCRGKRPWRTMFYYRQGGKFHVYLACSGRRSTPRRGGRCQVCKSVLSALSFQLSHEVAVLHWPWFFTEYGCHSSRDAARQRRQERIHTHRIRWFLRLRLWQCSDHPT